MNSALTRRDTHRACIASAMRAFYTMRIISGGDAADISYNSVFTALWSYAECTLGVIVACTLTIPKLIRAKGGKLRAIFSGIAKGFPSFRTRHGTESAPDSFPPADAVRLSCVELKTWHSDGEKGNGSS